MILNGKPTIPIVWLWRSSKETALTLTRMGNWGTSITKKCPGKKVTNSRNMSVFTCSLKHVCVMFEKCVVFYDQVVLWEDEDGNTVLGLLMGFSLCWVQLHRRFWTLLKRVWRVSAFGVHWTCFLQLLTYGMIFSLWLFNFGWRKNGIQSFRSETHIAAFKL